MVPRPLLNIGTRTQGAPGLGTLIRGASLDEEYSVANGAETESSTDGGYDGTGVKGGHWGARNIKINTNGEIGLKVYHFYHFYYSSGFEACFVPSTFSAGAKHIANHDVWHLKKKREGK